MKDKTIKKLELKPGDLLAARYDLSKVTPPQVFEALKALKITIERFMGFPVPVIPVFGSVDTLLVLDETMMAKQGWMRSLTAAEKAILLDWQRIAADYYLNEGSDELKDKIERLATIDTWENRLKTFQEEQKAKHEQIAQAQFISDLKSKPSPDPNQTIELTAEEKQHLQENQINALSETPESIAPQDMYASEFQSRDRLHRETN